MATTDRLVVYFSLDGHTAALAQAIAQAVEADLLELVPEKPYPRRGFRKYFLGGFKALRKEAPPLRPLAKDPLAYGMVFLGTPIWAGHPAPPLWSFLRQVDLTGRQVVLFCTCGHGPGAGLNELRAALGKKAEIVDEKIFVCRGKEVPSASLQAAAAWAQQVVEGGPARTLVRGEEGV